MVKTFNERFWNNVAKTQPDECWEWLATKIRNGYGSIGDRRPDKTYQIKLAHRASYEINIGEIPPKTVVCHTCDNRCCVNPAHLFLGTQADNVADMVAKGRQDQVLTAAVIPSIRARLRDGERPSAIAREFGVHRSTITKLRYGCSWAHVPD